MITWEITSAKPAETLRGGSNMRQACAAVRLHYSFVLDSTEEDGAGKVRLGFGFSSQTPSWAAAGNWNYSAITPA